MDTRKRIIRTLSVLIFSIGVLLSMVIFGIMVWGDIEAEMFDTGMRGKARLWGLRCPVMMSTNEIGTISATLKNSLERSTEYSIRTHISDGYLTLMREINWKLPLDPGEVQKLEWTVTPEDAAFERLILVRVRIGPKYPIPARGGSCGILVLDLPYLSGNQLFAIIITASLLCMAVGLILWVAANRPLRGLGLDITGAMGVLTGSLLIGMVVGYLGLWMFGVIIFVITLLFIGAIIGYIVNGLERKPI